MSSLINNRTYGKFLIKSIIEEGKEDDKLGDIHYKIADYNSPKLCIALNDKG